MNFLAEFKRRCRKIKEGVINKEQNVRCNSTNCTFNITRYRSDSEPVVVMWNLTEDEAKKLMSWKFVTGMKHENGEEVLVWYKARAMEPTR